MSNPKIKELFERKHRTGEKALIFFLTAGFPDEETFEAIVPALEEAGCDMLELGVPFSDPIADGPTIQRSSEYALEHGITLKKILDTTARLRKKVDMPLVLFSALNPLLKFGLEHLLSRAREVGIDGILCPDLPPEEADEMLHLCRDNDLSLVFLVAPTTPPERRQLIAQQSDGFIYYVSLKGVTGARERMSDDIARHVNDLKSITRQPVVVGFGISTGEHARMVAESGADGVVVGSALINLIEKHRSSPELVDKVKAFVASLKEGLTLSQ